MSAIAQALERETDKLLACVHCGLCHQVCPTYLKLGNENDSPRGRIYLMRAVAEDRLTVDSPAFLRHIDMCVGCRACETACPSGVLYGHLLEAARAEIAKNREEKSKPNLQELIKRFVLRRIFPFPSRVRFIFGFARWLKRTGLPEMAVKSGLVDSLPLKLQGALKLLVPSEGLSVRNGHRGLWRQRAPASAGVKPRKVAFFTGCVMETLFARINQATREALLVNGCEIITPQSQICCGALQAHAGERETAREMARKNIDTFEKAECEAIIINAAGCGAMLKEYGELLADDPQYAHRAEQFSKKVKDITEYLVQIGFRPGQRAIKRRVTYDAPCHLLHGQRVAQPPIQIIRSIPGIQFVPLKDSEMCCGSAGIYNLLQPEMSRRLQEDKIKNIRATGAEIVVTGNPGCHMQIASGAFLAGLNIQVMHPVELLAESYRL